jgi:hypothetical protein
MDLPKFGMADELNWELMPSHSFAQISKEWMVTKAPFELHLALSLSTTANFLGKTTSDADGTTEYGAFYALVSGRSGTGKSKATNLYLAGKLLVYAMQSCV